jgi:hypothetical protein
MNPSNFDNMIMQKIPVMRVQTSTFESQRVRLSGNKKMNDILCILGRYIFKVLIKTSITQLFIVIWPAIVGGLARSEKRTPAQ